MFGPEWINLIFAAAGALITFVAHRRGWIPSPAPAPAPGVTPVPGPSVPVIAPKTGNPFLDALLPTLLDIVRRELEGKVNELAKRILPPPDAPAVPSSTPVVP